MRYRVAVVVRLREGLLDPQGKAIEDALPHMGWTNVSGVRVGKHIEMTVDAADEEAGRRQVREIADRLLSNPVIERVEVRWPGHDPSGEPGPAAEEAAAGGAGGAGERARA